jgi:CHAT domain
MVFLFSSPLVLKTSESKLHFRKISEVQYREEFQGIIQEMTRKGVEFKYNFMRATVYNLKECLLQSLDILHFSGHGFRNDAGTERIYYGDEDTFKRNRNNGNVLLFEHDEGSSIYLYKNELSRILRSNNQYKLPTVVILSSCESESVGMEFASLGIPFVICTKKDVKNSATIEFSRAFYNKVYSDLTIH